MAVARVLAGGFALVVASLVGCTSTAAAAPVSLASPEPGYWLVGADGGVFAFNAPFEGSGAPGTGSPGLCPFAFGPTINISAASLANSGQVVTNLNCVGIAGSAAKFGLLDRELLLVAFRIRLRGHAGTIGLLRS